MEKIWLQSYPSAVPTEIDPDRYSSLPAMFAEVVAQHGARPAFSCMGARLSYQNLHTEAHHFAAWLRGDLQLPQGARVALMLPNVLAYPVCLYGTLMAGCIVVNCNPLYTAHELEHQLKDSDADVIVILENFAHVLEEVRTRVPLKHVVIVRMGDMLPTLKAMLVNLVVRHVKKLVPAYALPEAATLGAVLQRGAAQNVSLPLLHGEDIAFLQYTGGTTGVAKGAMLTHRNMIANILQASAWIRPFCQPGDEVIITALPLYHVFSLTANCFVYGLLGAENVLIPNPRDIPGFVKALRQHRFTAITGVNTLFAALLRNPDFAGVDFSHLRIALGGGAAVQRNVAEQWRVVTGKPLVEAYGLTETSPAVCINLLDATEYSGSIGLPLPSTEISLRDSEEREVAPGSPGEICIRGPQVMRGYWQRPDETALVLDEAGWLRTGDIGVMDERGFIRIVDRKKEMILVSGFNVYPSEVEAAVAEHPGVLEVAAISVPDERTGEAVKIYVVKKDPALTREALIAHCHHNLTGYKVPHQIEFRDDLPKSNVGKILRRTLRDEDLAQRKQA